MLCVLEYGGESWKQYNEILYDMLNRLQVFHFILILFSLSYFICIKAGLLESIVKCKKYENFK